MTDNSIHDACGRGDLETVRRMLAEEPSIVDADDQHNWRPIFHAALWRQEEVVSLLMESGADLSAHDGYVMHYAAQVPNNMKIVSQLIQYGALDSHVRPKSELQRQFLYALFLKDAERVRCMLSLHGQLATEMDGRNSQPIHHAARNGATRIVRLLVAHGADVNTGSEGEPTVLYCAAGHGHLETVKLLLDQGADIDAKMSQEGQTILDWLAQYPEDGRYVPILEYLREYRSNL